MMSMSWGVQSIIIPRTAERIICMSKPRFDKSSKSTHLKCQGPQRAVPICLGLGLVVSSGGSWGRGKPNLGKTSDLGKAVGLSRSPGGLKGLLFRAATLHNFRGTVSTIL